MAWFRYVLYFFGIAALTALLTRLEVANPGTLRLHEFVNGGDVYGTSEFSPVEMIQLFILAVCGLLMGWVAKYSQAQRPLAFLFGGLALVFLIREMHFFFDRYLIDNLWQVLVGVVGALLIAYCYRHRKRMNIALARIWPSPGLTLIFAGAVILLSANLNPRHKSGVSTGAGISRLPYAPDKNRKQPQWKQDPSSIELCPAAWCCRSPSASLPVLRCH
jgi:hypothetical protein